MTVDNRAHPFIFAHSRMHNDFYALLRTKLFLSKGLFILCDVISSFSNLLADTLRQRRGLIISLFSHGRLDHRTDGTTTLDVADNISQSHLFLRLGAALFALETILVLTRENSCCDGYENFQ